MEFKLHKSSSRMVRCVSEMNCYLTKGTFRSHGEIFSRNLKRVMSDGLRPPEINVTKKER